MRQSQHWPSMIALVDMNAFFASVEQANNKACLSWVGLHEQHIAVFHQQRNPGFQAMLKKSL